MSVYKGEDFDKLVVAAATEERSALKAASRLGVRYSTYRKHAIRLGVWKTNQSGKGFAKKQIESITIENILLGKHSYFATSAVKRKLFKAGLKENKCEKCGIKEWNNLPIVCQLDHIDGNRNNHVLENLRILCPNCHSQTVTYRGKNKCSKYEAKK